MRFSNKVRVIIFILVLATSTYIGFLLGNTFCAVDNKQNCNFELTIYIAVINVVGFAGVGILLNLAEKSITEWNQNSEEE